MLQMLFIDLVSQPPVGIEMLAKSDTFPSVPKSGSFQIKFI